MANVFSRVTRGIVVSTRDPLFSGRVKVWIPTQHGGPNVRGTLLDTSDGEGSVTNATTGTAPVKSTATVESDQGIPGIIDFEEVSTDTSGVPVFVNDEGLPWAYVLGHNWGPVGNILTGESSYTKNQPNGVMSIPAVGTEVFIIFEDDNPDQPIILGSVYHKDELLAVSYVYPLELSPGVTITDSSILTYEDYQNNVAKSYVIRSEKGSSLIISDIVGKEQIILGGTIKATSNAGDFTTGSVKYKNYAENYPNFPTTASASRAQRTKLGKATTLLYVATKTAQASPTGASGSTGSTGASSPTTPSSTTSPSSTASKKSYPVGGGFRSPSGGGVFHAARTRKGGVKDTHNGIDLGLSDGTPLIAPIDGFVLAYDEKQQSGTGGNWLVFKGVDGYLHRFMHLKDVDVNIKAKLQMKQFKVSQGTLLGHCGGTGKAPDGSAYAPHLHWEIIPLFNKDGSVFADSITNNNASDVFIKAQSNSKISITGTSIAVSKDSFIDAIEQWVKVETGSGLILRGNQFINTVQTTEDLDASSDKLIGLETCLTPGQEHIYLRHSSGSYLGFDADGNFKIFTVGDIQARVNRSIVVDVLGAVTTACLASFTRAKTVIRTAAALPLMHISNGHKFDPTNKIKDTYELFPEAIYDIDLTRLSDMQDALASIKSNIYVTSALGTTKTGPDILKDGFAIVLEETDKVPRTFSLTTYDGLIKKGVADYLSAAPEKEPAMALVAGAKSFTWKTFKAQMLLESNGDPTVHRGKSYGLFQLQPDAIREAKGSVMTIINGKQVIATPQRYIFDENENGDITAYSNPDKNIDAAMQYHRAILRRLYTAISNIRPNITKDITANEKEDMVKLLLLSYNIGITKVITQLKASLSENSKTISYYAVEAKLIDNLGKGVTRTNLVYAPLILTYILPKV